MRCDGLQPEGYISYRRTSYDARMMPAYGFAIHKVLGYEIKHEKMKSFKHGNNGRIIFSTFPSYSRVPKVAGIRNTISRNSIQMVYRSRTKLRFLFGNMKCFYCVDRNYDCRRF